MASIEHRLELHTSELCKQYGREAGLVRAVDDIDVLARLGQDAVGFVFQAIHLMDELTAAENVELPALLAGPDPDPDGDPVRAVIAGDSVLLREGITRLLAEDGIEVVAGVGEAESLLRAVGEHKPDLAVIDVRTPPGHRDEGLRAAIEIRRRWPGIALLVLSQFVEERYATELLAAGTRAIGYLLKDRVADVAEFIDALRRVAAGGTVLDPEAAQQILARSCRSDPFATLTGREREVLALMAEGRSNSAIARSLVLSKGAVEKRVASIFTKLDLPPDDEQTNRRVMAVVRYLNS